MAQTSPGHAAFNLMIDRHVGELLKLLKELSIDEQTIVFFCSDHGASERFEGSLNSCGPLTGHKRSMHEGGLRVPLIVRWPRKIAPGTVSDLQTYFPDALPTLAELGGCELAPESTDGISIVPTLLGRHAEQEKHAYLYWEWPTFNWDKMRYQGLSQAVRHGNWKMLRRDSQRPWKLFDLAVDLAERNDLAEQYPNVVEQLATWVQINRTDPPPQVEPTYPKGKRFH